MLWYLRLLRLDTSVPERDTAQGLLFRDAAGLYRVHSDLRLGQRLPTGASNDPKLELTEPGLSRLGHCEPSTARHVLCLLLITVLLQQVRLRLRDRGKVSPESGLCLGSTFSQLLSMCIHYSTYFFVITL